MESSLPRANISEGRGRRGGPQCVWIGPSTFYEGCGASAATGHPTRQILNRLNLLARVPLPGLAARAQNRFANPDHYHIARAGRNSFFMGCSMEKSRFNSLAKGPLASRENSSVPRTPPLQRIRSAGSVSFFLCYVSPNSNASFTMFGQKKMSWRKLQRQKHEGSLCTGPARPTLALQLRQTDCGVSYVQVPRGCKSPFCIGEWGIVVP